jgi:DNA topoisomerase-1
LGYHVARVEATPWKEYSHLGLNRVTLEGEARIATAPRFTVKSVETKRVKSKPSPPFTTASLQQVAANQLRFATSRTMKIAQGLYEGIDIQTGEGSVGLITYMRTDSTNLSGESVQAVRGLIEQSFGEKYVPTKPIHYASGKQAQEAHEAIRPTDVRRTPESLRGHLTTEQHKLYELIWNRFVACQMAFWFSTASTR